MLQQKIQQMQQATARNEQKLHAYQWIETVTVTIDGSPKPPRQSICRYAPDGTLYKTPLGPRPQMPAARGGPFRKMIVEKRMANKIVAAELAISEETVKAHMRSILSKLAANDRTHAVTIALKRGIINI
jgi:Bacterial regulatory proteins, luxR family